MAKIFNGTEQVLYNLLWQKELGNFGTEQKTQSSATILKQ